jgi:hypothetical protein
MSKKMVIVINAVLCRPKRPLMWNKHCDFSSFHRCPPNVLLCRKWCRIAMAAGRYNAAMKPTMQESRVRLEDYLAALPLPPIPLPAAPAAVSLLVCMSSPMYLHASAPVFKS